VVNFDNAGTTGIHHGKPGRRALRYKIRMHIGPKQALNHSMARKPG